jgi:ribonuclease P protein component
VKRSNRLIKDADFQTILAKKTTHKNNYFIIYGLKQSLGHTRVGLSVSKKLGNAVVRNRIRRQIRMMLMATQDLTESIDYLIVVRSEYLKVTFLENQKQLTDCLLTLRRKLV